MRIIDQAFKQAQVWQAYSALHSRNAVERYNAINTLRGLGDSALVCLEIAIRQASQARVQFSAAVVLHFLGDGRGMHTLTEALKWRSKLSIEIQNELVQAFNLIGSPDAVEALINVWNGLPDWGDHFHVRDIICKIWADLRNPQPINALTSKALLVPSLFERTMPAFGVMAVSYLKTMSCSLNPRERLLAVHTLRHIHSPRSFQVLVPLLRDPDPTIRLETPIALAHTGEKEAASIEICKAVEEGYATTNAISFLMNETSSATCANALISYIEKCQLDQVLDIAEKDALLMSLTLLQTMKHSHLRSLNALCKLLNKTKDDEVCAVILNTIGMIGPSDRRQEAEVRRILWEYVASADMQMRYHASGALLRWGDARGQVMLSILARMRPKGTLLDEVSSLFLGSKDTGANTKTVHQVSRWLAKVTDSVGALLSEPQKNWTPEEARFLAIQETQFTLKRMLGNTLKRLERSISKKDMEEVSLHTISVLDTIKRIGMPVAKIYWDEIRAIFHFEGQHSGSIKSPSELRQHPLFILRCSAAETLFELYGNASFPLILEALYSISIETNAAAIQVLGHCGDARAIPHLQRIVADTASPLDQLAQEAIHHIRKINPDMMTLLRGASATATSPDELLRPASGSLPTSPMELLRPSNAQPDTTTNPQTSGG